MKDSTDPRLEFYRGDGVQLLLKRYPVSEEEKRLLYRAVRTAKRDRIDWRVIDEADELVREIHRDREPLVPLEEEILRANRMTNEKVRKFSKAIPRSIFRLVMIAAVLLLLLLYSPFFFPELWLQREAEIDYVMPTHVNYGGGDESTKEAGKQTSSPHRAEPAKTGSVPQTPHHLRRDLQVSRPASYPVSHNKPSGGGTITFSLKAESPGWKFCRWEEGDYQYRYDPLDKDLLSKSECEAIMNMVPGLDIKAPSGAVKGLKAVGKLEVSKKGLICRVTVYTDPYRRFRVGFIDPKTLEACALYLSERRAYVDENRSSK